MKSIIILLILIISLGLYIDLSGNNNVLPLKKSETYQVSVEKISSTSAKTPPVREINYFETDKDINNWLVRSDEWHGINIQQSLQNVSQGASSMQINWKTSKWGELVLMYFPEDWQKYKNFGFDIFNPDNQELSLELKIGDKFDTLSFYPKANKFIIKTTLKPGWNKFKLKMSDIKNKIDVAAERKVIHLRFFNKGKAFYLDNMRLER
jgi:hypothetical protein